MKFKPSVLTAGIAAALAGPVYADPPPINGLPTVFCFRVTDMERTSDSYVDNPATTGVDETGDPINGILGHDDRFRMAFEVLNWSNRSAIGLQMFLNQATLDAGDKMEIHMATIDRDGRGGSTPTGDLSGIGKDPKYGEIDTSWDPNDPIAAASEPTLSDPISHHGGRGNAAFLNDWTVYDQTPTSVLWDADAERITAEGYGFFDPRTEQFVSSESFFTEAGDDSTQLRNEDLLAGRGRVPGTGLDALGDLAVDGGPGCIGAAQAGQSCNGPDVDGDNVINSGADYIPGLQDNDPLVGNLVRGSVDFDQSGGRGNVLDGFVLDIWGFDEGDVLSLDWTLLAGKSEFGIGQPAAFASSFIDEDGYGGGGTQVVENCSDLSASDCFESIGVSGFGNDFGFGTFTLERGVLDVDGNVDFINDPNLPGFGGNPNQDLGLFYADTNTGRSVANLPNTTAFRGGLTGGSTVGALNAADDLFGLNSTVVPAPATIGMMGAGMFSLLGAGWWRRRKSRES